MDTRKWNTEKCLFEGVLDRPAPVSSVPKDFEAIEVEEGEWCEESLLAGLRNGGLTASMYYGCWDIWKTKKGFSGQLLQYRVVTESFSDETLDYALQKAIEWASGTQE